jgi:hypothetical protein
VPDNRKIIATFLSQNWRVTPVVSYQTIVQLIAATTAETGLTVRCELDTASYPSGITVPDAETREIDLTPCRIPWRMELCNRPFPNTRASAYSLTEP